MIEVMVIDALGASDLPALSSSDSLLLNMALLPALYTSLQSQLQEARACIQGTLGPGQVDMRADVSFEDTVHSCFTN